jgi:integrase
VTRMIVDNVVGQCKTESSQKPVPVHPLLTDAMLKWRERCRCKKPDVCVFASRLHRGRKPCRGQAILRQYVRPRRSLPISRSVLAGTPFATMPNAGLRRM